MSAINDPALERLYDSFWATAEPALARGEVKIDEHLHNRHTDQRRGLTVIVRLADAVAHAIGAFIDELYQAEPGQYLYAPGQCHVTVLSLRTAASDYVHDPETIAAYELALNEALSGATAFRIRFAGVTATPEAVLIRGFPQDEGLNQLRTKIVETMAAHGLPVKQRYSPKTAHVTVMRFSQPAENPAALVGILRSSQTRFFGVSEVRRIEMVENDWYMAPDKLHVIRTFDL